MASDTQSNTKVPKYNAAVENKPVKKNKKKKSIVTMLSNKIQKKISKTLIKTFEMTPMTPNHTKLIKDHSEQNVNKNDHSKGSSSRESTSKETARERRLREISDRKKKEEENSKTNNKPKLLPVPPRFSSNIPVRGSSSNYDVNYYNSNLFDHCTLSQSLPGSNSNVKDEKHELAIKRSNSELTPSSSTENLSQLNKFVDTKSKYKSDVTLVQDSKITLSLADEIFKETSIHHSDSSHSESSSSGSSSPTSSSSSFSSSSSSGSSIAEKNKSLNDDNADEDDLTNSEKFYFDEKRQKTIRRPIRSEKSRKVNELFRRDSEKYMDQQLVDLCSTYYKDYYYGKYSDSSDTKSSSNSKSDSDVRSNGDSDSGTDDEDKDDVIEINSARFNRNSQKSKSDDENSDSNNDRDYSYIVKSNSSSSYFIPNKHSSFKVKDSNCTISKSKTLPVMDSKNVSPKIITCPSSDPDKPTTHLVNISGVTIQTNDLCHLFWVPSYLHPEVHPLEFKKIMSTEANTQGKFARHTSIRRTKSFAESARVITPDNISENGEPVINLIQRHKTFDTFKSMDPKEYNRRKFSLKKSMTIEEESETIPNEDELSLPDKTKEELLRDHEIINVKEDNKEKDHQTIHDKEKVDLKINTSLKDSLPSVSTLPSAELNKVNTSPTKPLNPSTLQNSTSIPDSSSEESLSQSGVENDDSNLSPKIFLPNAADDTENVPLVHGSHKVTEEEEEDAPAKSGWSLFLSSFSKEDKKEMENSKKNKRNSAVSPKSPFAFFKSSSSSSLAHKNINYRQGKGTIKAYLLEYPLIFKPMTREAEDTIYSLSHTKLATTYRPMVQQVFINNIMQKYIRKYKDAAYKIPFKQVRPPKKRRAMPRTPPPKKQQRPVNTPPLSQPTANFSIDEPIKARTDSKNKKHGKRIPTKKLVDLNESKLNELLERGIESQDINSKKPKRRSKARPLSDSFSEKDIQSVYKNLKNSTSMEQIDDQYSKSSSMKNDSKRYSASVIVSNNQYDYSNYSISSSEDDDDDDDDEIPLAMLKNRRSSIITI